MVQYGTTMKKFFLLCAVAVAALSLTSCGVTSTASQNITETKVVLGSKNFKVVGQAYGEAKATYVLGIGGLRRSALINNAIDEMSKNAKLTGSQTLINTTTHTATKLITPLYIQRTCTATATIIEFE